ncbi:BglG family transcription antiterminator [Lacticaseibacillus zeae]|uniref:PTS sugar transporter subunit IIA n=1 Tax=Lacticaseibacillus zeae subsp. silagei TaxID=3068307 RepID=A0ABD7ZD41_LACZE|nr:MULTISPECIES: PTS sugar transporter subunit IIA [Lacticaseibacillus]OFR91597.1 hypothetical protein HMPREF2861_12635 [Lactobacillus sp. HMSC068F07]WLV85045.1 PTS sugar transporter subunit IIA [Lacticaseibacillus sp. NCIMB 15475]WLV87768.1 PTS sugar transporter subunit IIA [Lacticaseibacillus sp. NCIMB 15474]
MHFSDRERKLMNLLLNSKGYLTAAEISNQLFISTKTVYRTVDHVNEIAPNHDLITGSKGQGFRINYSSYLLLNRKQKREKEASNAEIVERQADVLYDLLWEAPASVKVHDLFEPYYVSESQIEADVKAIRADIQTYALQIKRQNMAIQVVGKEDEIRRALQDQMMARDIIEASSDQSRRKDLNVKTLAFSMSLLHQVETELNASVPYPYNLNIAIPLYIMITRNRKGRSIVIDETESESTTGSVNSSSNQRLFKLAAKTITHVESYLNKRLPPGETTYLLEHLLSSRFLKDGFNSVKNVTTHGQAYEVSRYYLERMGEVTGKKIEDLVLLEELTSHIQPMLARLSSNIHVHNVLLDDIERLYPRHFENVSRISKEVEMHFHTANISTDENGFIALYFAKYYEQNEKSLKALVVCTTGIATAKLLAVKIRASFSQLEIVDVVARDKVEERLARDPSIELVISTVSLNNINTIPVIVVNALMTSRDRDKVSSFLNRIEGSEKMLSDVTNRNLIQVNISVQNWEEAIRKSAQPLIDQGYVLPSYVDDMVNTTKEAGPYIVISKGVALPHARPEKGAQRVGIAISTLETPISFGNKANDPVSYVFALSATDSRTHLRALSELVELIGQEAFMQALRDATTPEAIYGLITKFEERCDFNG